MLALKEVGWTRDYVANERLKHTVSGELALEGFLQRSLRWNGLRGNHGDSRWFRSESESGTRNRSFNPL